MRDRAKMEEQWRPNLESWYPAGLKEPDLALLKLNVERAERWDSGSRKMVRSVGLVQSVTTGSRASRATPSG